MELSLKYNPAETEEKWYSYWMEKGFFSSKPDPEKEPFTIVIPPPNVTGMLHMGHMMNNTIQDVLIRRARMQGKEACWVPGTDHASIATEAKVVAMLAEQGIKKSDLTREQFLSHAMEWKEKYGGIILEQLKKLGASCDWDRTKFTMDPEMSEAVIDVFIDLYNKGLIYRGVRMVNWDPKGLTALSDEEVYHKEVQSKLYYINYAIEGEGKTLTIATTRPETLLGDTAICVNPNDERYKHLIGKKAIVPLVNRVIPIIGDDYVDLEFGTGCLKVTPAHDLNDYELGIKHKLEVIDILNDDGTLNGKAQYLVGENRFVARKKIAKTLEESGQLVKIEEITNKVGYSERTNEVIEPKLSTQWFCKMGSMAEPALENVLNDTIQIHPPKFKNMYRSWMENIKDWCISRQLWWGQQIPAYYAPNGEFVVAKSKAEAIAAFNEKGIEVTENELVQDEDVLDTWFSSWLWPISVFDGIRNPDNEEINYYFPTNDLVTGFDIIFFWVARMIMAGYEFKGELPFKNVYITGMVRDSKGRKMSKQLGNSPDPIDLMKQYGADGVRVGMLLAAPAGNDLLFDEKLCEQGSKFANKIWQALRLVKSWEVADTDLPASSKIAIEWLESRIDQSLLQIEDHYEKYRISDALMSVYKLVWDEFCSWYLEMVKPEYGKPIDKATYEATISFFEAIVKIVHPFMPFITEEIWHAIAERSADDCVIIAKLPAAGTVNEQLLKDVEQAQEIVTAIRNLKSQNGLPKHENAPIAIKTEVQQFYTQFGELICKMAMIEQISFDFESMVNTVNMVVKSDEVFMELPEGVASDSKEDLLKELEYQKGFLASVEKKLSNERFVSGAPEAVVDKERQKKADAEAKIKALEESLAG